MKNYEFVTSPAASEVIDELAKQIGVDAAGVTRHGLILAAQQFRRHDLVQKLEPIDCVGLSNVSGQDAEPEVDPQRDTDPPEGAETQNEQQAQTPPGETESQAGTTEEPGDGKEEPEDTRTL